GNWQFAGVGDIWGIGQKAIVGLDSSTNQWWATWAVGTGTTTAQLQAWAAGTQYAYLHLQDTNGDGRMDWVGFDQTNGLWTAGFWSSGSGIVSKGLGAWIPAVNWTDVSWADVNGDGLPDIVGYNSTSRSWTFLLSAAGGAYQQQSIVAPLAQSNWSAFLIGDINGDGRAELLGLNGTNGNWQELSWNNGALSLQTIGKWSLNGSWSQLQLADVNGDGIADIVGFNSQANTWSVLTDISGQFTTAKVAWTASTSYSDLDAGAVPGMSNATLRRQILQQIPGLASALASSPLTAASLLLNWTANAADFAIDPQYLLQSPASAADAYYNYFQTDAAGESCGGYAWFYSAILKLFNIDSLDIGVGVNGTDLTHAFVVIPQKQNGSWKFYVFDPTFNLTFSTPTSSVADYFQLMDYENSGRSNQVTVNQGNLSQRHFLAASPQSPATFTPVKVTGGTYVYTDANYGLTSFLATWQPLMQQYGYPANVTGYLQFLESYVLSVSTTSSDPTTRNAFVSQLQAYGIPNSGS
ncbi:MAG TPA: VCBS repeat-containing protein, partial [Planctomycetaceae bacterium]|nr:VCBS repeat-containing protein [Planctomycetaceae bacterium]